MKKYRVTGTTVVTVTKEVWAHNEDEAYEKAYNELSELTAYAGNGGIDQIVGIYDDDASISADCEIEYDDIEVLEDDPDYFECPECGEECEKRTDKNGDYWWCESCWTAFDEDGDEFEFEEEEEEED